MYLIILILTLLYVNLIRFVELKDSNQIISFDDYIKYCGYIFIPYNLTIVIIFIAVWIIKTSLNII
jgi:glutaredoxin-related protein